MNKNSETFFNDPRAVALLSVAEGIFYSEILFSISLPSNILHKYQNLKNSLLHSSDFSLNKFSSVFSPRLPSGSTEDYSTTFKSILTSLNHILDKTLLIIDSPLTNPSNSSPNRSFSKQTKEKALFIETPKETSQ